MTEHPPSPNRRGARTFRAACAVLATVAAAQAAATAWSSKTQEAAVAVEVAKKPAPPPRPVDPFSQDFRPEDPHPEMQGPAGDAPPDDPALVLLQPKPAAPVPRPKAPAPLDVPITDETVLENLDVALSLRSRGDMQGALTQLREALKKLPNHPKLIYQTARTLDTMGLTQKALPYWKSLHKLGGGTGDFFTLAKERMANGPQVSQEAEEEKEGKFTITDLRDEKMADSNGGERVLITAVLKKHTGENPDLEKDMGLIPHFFDTVNGRRIARSQVGQPPVQCTSLPLDWQDGTETFTLEYWQPDMTPQEIVRWGRCKYYGCTLEVFYKEKLQDSTATTPELLQLARELPLPAPEPESNILESTPAPGAAEPGLFPPQLKP